MQEERGGPIVPTPVGQGLTPEEQALVLAHRQGWRPPGEAPAPPPPQPPRLLRLLLGGIGATFGLVLVALLLVLLVTLVNFMSIAGQPFAGVGERAAAAAGQTGRAIGDLLQGLADRVNPSHPPRVPLAQDTEFDGLRIVAVGDLLGETGEYEFRVEAIRRRDNSATLDTAQFAVVKRQYRAPKETKIAGVTVRVDRGEAEHYLDRGESFRLGRALYKVNWVSAERGQVAVGQYRQPDRVTVPLDFAYD
jgi:hypothetical protein